MSKKISKIKKTVFFFIFICKNFEISKYFFPKHNQISHQIKSHEFFFLNESSNTSLFFTELMKIKIKNIYASY